LAELIPAGVEAVLAAFRTALCSLAVRNNIEGPSHDRHRSWSAVVNAPENEASELIQRFILDKVSKDKVIPDHGPYDGAN
jgi:naphtho-gamma-pyrone polyketide synthase